MNAFLELNYYDIEPSIFLEYTNIQFDYES